MLEELAKKMVEAEREMGILPPGMSDDPRGEWHELPDGSYKLQRSPDPTHDVAWLKPDGVIDFDKDASEPSALRSEFNGKAATFEHLYEKLHGKRPVAENQNLISFLDDLQIVQGLSDVEDGNNASYVKFNAGSGQLIQIEDGGVRIQNRAEPGSDEYIKATIEGTIVFKGASKNDECHIHASNPEAEMMMAYAAERLGIKILNPPPEKLEDVNPELAKRMDDTFARMQEKHSLLTPDVSPEEALSVDEQTPASAAPVPAAALPSGPG